MTNPLTFPSLSNEKKESLFTGIFAGTVLIILAIVYFLHTTIFQEIYDFFANLTLSAIPGTSISLPAPADPASHLNLYYAAFQFSIALGVLEVAVLIVRVIWNSSVYRKAETIENIVFWMGTSYLIITYLVHMTIPGEWFVFWAGIIMIFGLSLIARAFVLLVRR